MKPFCVEETEGERTAWIYPEAGGEYEPVQGEPEPKRVALKIRYWTPEDKEILHNKLIHKGILRQRWKGGREGTPQVVKGREADRNLAFAEALVVDWRCLEVNGQTDFSPALMAVLLSKVQDIADCVFKAADDFSLFFGSNGGASSGN